MPVPKPNDGEGKDEFISRCISALHDEDPEKPNEQISAICYSSWENSKNSVSLKDELLQRFDNIRTLLVNTLGKRGEALLNYTLIRLGVYDIKMQKFNMAAFDGTMNLPFIKEDCDGSKTICNLMAPSVEFAKIDNVKGTIEGYANTITIDTYSDIFLPEAYKESFEKEYGTKSKPIYFMHHTDVPGGELVEMKFDDIGMYVVTKPYDYVKQMANEGKIRGFSIGFSFKIYPDFLGMAYVSHKKFAIYGDDISYVTLPANLASYFLGELPESDARLNQFVSDPERPIKARQPAGKSESSEMTDGNGVIVANINQKENEKMSKEEKQETKPTVADEIAKLLKNQKEEAAKEILIQLQKTTETEALAKKEDRLTKVEEAIGNLTGLFNSFKAEMLTAISGVNTKFQKIEAEPDLTRAGAVSTQPPETLETIAQGSMSLNEFQEKVQAKMGVKA